jgi:hypothetical protein
VTPARIYQDDAAELWHADALDPEHVAAVMGERVADALIVDAPYSAKTHNGHRDGAGTAANAAAFALRHANNPSSESRYAARKSAAGGSGRNDLTYPAWAPSDVARFVSAWDAFCSGWRVSITDNVLAPDWATEFSAVDLYPFAPLPLVETGSRVRMSGDGPSGWTCWIIVARPRSREFASWGTLPGAYMQAAERDINSAGGSDRIVGGKPLQSMSGLVRDYSRRGGLIVDPCCGAGTTLVAAKAQGRRSIGLDLSVEHLAIAARRLAKRREQRDLFENEAP